MKIRNIILGLMVICLITGCNHTKYVNAVVKDNNIYATKTDGEIEQVTYIGKDSKPLISPDRKVIYFIRQTGNFEESENKGGQQLAIMQVELPSLKEEKLTDTIQYADWKSTSEIYEVRGFTLSQDGRFIYFITQKWVTSGVLVKLNTMTKEMIEISDGYNFELLKRGQYKDNIIITRSSIKSNAGRQLSNWLIDIYGKEIKEIGDDDAVINFKLNSDKK